MNTVCMQAVCFIPFSAAVCIHLVYCFYDKKRQADRTKTVLMPLLLFAYTAAVHRGGSPFSILILIAVMGSWLGDIFLLRDDDKSFLLGLLFFAAAQLTFAYFAYTALVRLNTDISLTYGIVLIPYLLIIAGMLKHLSAHLGKLILPVCVYMACISLMSIGFVLYALVHTTAASVLAAIGSLFFVISDSVLAHTVFIGRFPRSRFIIMLTYTAAEGALTAGALGMI